MAVIISSKSKQSQAYMEEARPTHDEWKRVANNIVNNRHFRAFLMANKAGLRREIYDALKPHLNFKAKPYFLLNA